MNQLSRQYGTYEKQEILLSMIKDIDLLFTQNDIAYSLCGGTLLGAVRENGFIPWDDDIDIMVNRQDYNKIVALFSSLGDSTNYCLRRYLWIDRIQRKDDSREGLFADTIDVFVMDNCPDNEIVRKLKVVLIKMLQGMMKVDHDLGNQSSFYKACLLITRIMGKPFSEERKFKWYHRIAQIGNRKKTKYMTGYTDLFKLLSLRYSGKLFDAIARHKFEDIELPITSEYDSYLSTQYGDYMTPPKQEDRNPIHMSSD